jgi:hypothetical protein
VLKIRPLFWQRRSGDLELRSFDWWFDLHERGEELGFAVDAFAFHAVVEDVGSERESVRTCKKNNELSKIVLFRDEAKGFSKEMLDALASFGEGIVDESAFTVLDAMNGF